MPSELLMRVDWDLIYPKAVPKFFSLVAACKERGFHYFAISGHRSYEEQQALYEIGRVPEDDTRKPVTKARPGQSSHNFGVAVDFCLDANVDRRGLQPDWNLEHYEVLAEEAEKLGLEPALRWRRFKEGPHVQLPLTRFGLSTHLLDLEYQHGGLEAVWRKLDSVGPW